MRYFGQTPDYWLDNGTLPDWENIWGRELLETPPTDVWAGAYFKHQPPEGSALDDDPEDAGEWDSGLPEETE